MGFIRLIDVGSLIDYEALLFGGHAGYGRIALINSFFWDSG
jgi:hypothetical protein